MRGHSDDPNIIGTRGTGDPICGEPLSARAEMDRFKAENKRLVAENNAQRNEIIDLKRLIQTLERHVRDLSAPAILADIEKIRAASEPRQT